MSLTLVLVAATVLVSWLAFNNPRLAERLILWPPAVDRRRQYDRLLTYGFMHGNFAHLLFNMLALVMFGAPLEHVWGDRRYLTYYLVCIVGAALCQIGVGMWAMSQGEQAYPTVGASGGIFGLLLAFGLAFPRRRLMLIFPPIPMPAWLFVTLYGLLELYLGVSGHDSGVAHFAHLGGMVGGFALILFWRAQQRR